MSEQGKLRDIFNITLPSINYIKKKSKRNSHTRSRSATHSTCSYIKGEVYYPEQILHWENFDEECDEILKKYNEILDKDIEDLPEIPDEQFDVKEEKNDLYNLFDETVFKLCGDFILYSELVDSIEFLFDKKVYYKKDIQFEFSCSPYNSKQSVPSEDIGDMTQRMNCLKIQREDEPSSLQNEAFLTPDYVVSIGKNEGFLFPIEIKIKRKFEFMTKTDKIHTLYNEQINSYKKSLSATFRKPDVVQLILQIYKYMLRLRFYYGVLTTYDSTWVLKFEENPGGVEKVYISKRIKNSKLVKILVCVFLFTLQDKEQGKEFIPDLRNRAKLF